MGMHGSSLLHFIQKFQSWMSWGNGDTNSIFPGFETMDNSCSICSNCARNVVNSYPKYQCRICEIVLCDNCSKGLTSMDRVLPTNHLKETAEAVIYTMSCKICSELSPPSKSGRRCSGKVYPSESPRHTPEPPSPSFSGEGSGGHSPLALTRSSDVSLSNHPSLVSAHRSSRSYDDEGEHLMSHFFSIPNEYFHDASDVDSSSVSVRHEFYSAMSLGSSPSDSPSRSHATSSGVGCHVQLEQRGTPTSQDDHEQPVLERPAKGIWDAEDADDLPIPRHISEELPQPLDFENNGLIWFPPPADDANDEVENNLFTYDDEDDEVGDSGVMFLPTTSIDVTMFSAKEKQYHDEKGPWRSAVLGHFRALVSQLLQVQGIINGKDNCGDDWLEIITTIAWQAAKFLKPDTSRGGSMDPCDYLKVKCVASGSPCQSKFIKGVVCTKNIKHKRMTSQYKNARLLLLGGALEYQRASNHLASFETLLQQENDHLKTIVSKIEAHRPNVLLVEKSVSSFALEHLLAKEISLVLNVKKPLLEKIARCTGASITPSTDHISTTRLGHCEIFRLEKVSEDHEPVNQFNRKPSKTLMFFEGCPRRLGCTVVLRGSCREELRKLKHVTQYAVFAAYHLSLETSFLVDEGASLPKVVSKSSGSNTEQMALDKAISAVPDSAMTTSCTDENKVSDVDLGSADLTLELGLQESLSEFGDASCDDVSIPDEFRYRKALSEACNENLALDVARAPDDLRPTCSSIRNHTVTEAIDQVEGQSGVVGLATPVHGEDTEASSEYFSANDSHHSILVSFSSHNMAYGTVCERSRLVRLKFYGNSDKPLGRYLRDDLFDQSFLCRSCKEPAEAHVMCYTHQHANLTINVKRLLSVKLPGEQDGKIWMWHRCLRCERTGGVPPATQRVVMSDAAWGLSFGKFLELSFSNHATGNRIASCGHSLQRDCLRFYGFGNMVAFFRYSPINILSVRLPPSTLEFGDPGEQPWIRGEAYELLSKAKALHAEISRVLDDFKSKCVSSMDEFSDANELHNHVLELNGMLSEEKTSYEDLLQFADKEAPEQCEAAIDILEINRMRHSLLVGSRVWDRRLFLLDSLLKRGSSPKAAATDVTSRIGLQDSDSSLKDNSLGLGPEDDMSAYPKLEECASDEGLNSSRLESGFLESYERLPRREDLHQDEENAANSTALERAPSAASILSDKIDSAWSGADLVSVKSQALDMTNVDVSETLSFPQINQRENPVFRRLTRPARVHSFDSAQRLQERIRRGLPPSSLYLSNIRSFHASGDYRHMVRDPIANVQRTYSQVSMREAEKFNISSTVSPSFISSLSLVPEGARLMVLHNGHEDVVVTVYDNEPTSIISYALSSKEYDDWVAGRLSGTEIGSNVRLLNKVNSLASELSTWQSFGSLDSDYMNYGSYSSDDGSSTSDQDNSPHLRISFEDDSSNAGGKVKFSVTSYYAKQFDSLRRKCCPCEVDFVRSLSRCKRWSAQGGKSNVYFAKSFDDRFIIKQVTKTELESFEEFALQYFKYLKDALTSGSPTCLAKVLGIFQVTVKKGGKDVKMDLMVMENLFYNRNISRVYDLKGSSRSRYNSDTTGANKVLLDMNLLETLRTNPIFLGGKAKRSLERAVWNDTSFLAAVDVMDYSLLVGVDEERKELVMGIIDFMRQYTWDKHLETWVKASGILGGPKNASPTIISPKQYKKRFRKAMTTYFLTVPDQWSS